MHRFIKYCLITLACLVAFSCTTKRNTATTRFFHNLTSKYNIMFNGGESYKSGMNKLIDTYDDDLSRMLPVFLYSDKDALATIAPEMDRTIKKATKVISMHSLTVKPKIKPDKELSQKQKAFYNKREYNKYVDDAYLLMGKAHFYKMEYPRARETFNYIISNYPEDESVYEARIWLARLAIEEGRFREGGEILESLQKNLEFPKSLRGELAATFADLRIKQTRYSESVEYLKTAIEHTRKKQLRVRYTYLMAQLYSELGEYAMATDYYSKVINMNPPYTMTFNARINQALSYQSGAGSRKDIEKTLRKMLKDDKNIEYQDQIYYALGNLYLQDNQKEKALEHYLLSLSQSTDNYRQKARTSLTLADIYYEQPQYILAQAYYDSAVSVIDEDYPGYQTIHTKSVSLNKLVESIRTVQFEDSVLTLAGLPESELNARIDKIIEDEMKAEQERREREQQLAQERLDNLAMQNNLNRVDQGGNWYFYNPAAKNLGKKEFIQQWGNRKLEDNWRRKNKSTVSFADQEPVAAEETGDSPEKTTQAARVTNKKDRVYYLQYIPFSDSAKTESLERIKTGLYTMGEVYGGELKDFPEAIKAYEQLLSRFPQFENRLQVYYKLYKIAKENEDIERLSKYQQKIISEFPESHFARLMTNPNYISELETEEKKMLAEYESIRKMFDARRYSQVAPRAMKMMQEHPNHELLPKIDFMYTVSSGIKKDTLAFINDLRSLIRRYPGTEIANNSEAMINYLENASPEVVVQQTLQTAKKIYFRSDNETHFFAYVVPNAINFNQLIFNIVNFNLDYYDKERLDVRRVGIEGKNSLCVVQSFGSAGDATSYLLKISGDQTIFRDVEDAGVLPVIISRTNFNKLRETNKMEEYILFYKENYK